MSDNFHHVINYSFPMVGTYIGLVHINRALNFSLLHSYLQAKKVARELIVPHATTQCTLSYS